jgi:hypothetical protein
MRKELKKGDTITFTREGFKITPVCDKSEIDTHIKFLKERVKNSAPDANIALIETRIKNLNSKVLKIFIPDDLRRDVNFNRELDYLLRMIESSTKGYQQVRIDGRELMIPKVLYKYVVRKVNTTKDMFYNIDKMLIRKE